METKVDEYQFENCLAANVEYQSEVAKLEQLKEKRKKIEMGHSFGEYGQAKDIEAENQAVEAILKEDNEKISDYVSLPPKERTERMINLLVRAIRRQEQVVRRMEPVIWREAVDLYEDGFEAVYNELIDNAILFGKSLLRLQQLQFHINGRAGIPARAWPARWHISQEFLQRVGIGLNGLGFLPSTIEVWQRNWRGDTDGRKRKANIEAL